jgi:predicted HTH transcriptional regulator
VINEPETLVQEYKHYEYPFNRYLKDVLLKTICGFLNGRGGIIYIGIK